MRIFKDKKLIHSVWGNHEEVQLHVGTYANGRVALQLMARMRDEDFPDEEECLEPYMTCSVNLPNEPCSPDEVFIKDWNENVGIIEWLQENGVIESKGTGYAQTGYVVAERFKLTPATMEEIARTLTEGKNVRQRGNTVISLLTGVMLVAVGFTAGWSWMDMQSTQAKELHHIRLILEEQTCRTDEQCVNACLALGGGKECADVMGPESK